MKKVLFACLLLQTFLLHAQDISVAMGPQFKLKDFDYRKTSTADKMGDFFYGMKYTQKRAHFGFTVRLDDLKIGIELTKSDAGMNVIKSVAMQNGQADFGPFPPRVKIFGNRVLLFFYKVQPDGSIKLFVSDINNETLADAKAIDLYTFSQKNVGLFSLESAYESNKLDFCLTPDSTKMLVALSGTSNEIFSCLIDDNLAITSSKVSVQKNNPNAVTINSAYIDKDGNRYFGYTYKLDKLLTSGVMINDSKGLDHYIPFSSAMPGSQGGDLLINGSNDNTKVYVYGGYKTGDLSKGVFLTTVDAARLTINRPVLFPYPDDVMENLRKLDFAYKSHGEFGIENITYTFTDLENGAVALTGYPYYTKQSVFTNSTASVSYAGPVMAVIFKGGKAMRQ